MQAENFMHSKISIRPMDQSELRIFRDLNREIHELHFSAHPEIFKPKYEISAEDFEALVSNPHCSVLVAEIEGVAAGMISLERILKKESSGAWAAQVLYIHQIGVRFSFREKGVATRLLNEAKKLAKSVGIKRIELDVWAFNRSAKYFFESGGFEVFNEKMAMDLE